MFYRNSTFIIAKPTVYKTAVFSRCKFYTIDNAIYVFNVCIWVCNVVIGFIDMTVY